MALGHQMAQMSDNSRRSTNKEQTRAALVRAGRRVFAKRGFADASLGEIAKAARVTTGAVYHHFADKAALFRAVAENVEQDIMAAVVAASGDRPSGDVAVQLRRGIEAMLEVTTAPDIQRVAFVDAPVVLGPTAWREIEAQYAYGLLYGSLTVLHKEGRLKGTPELIAPILLGALTEAAVTIARAGDQAKARADARAAMASVLSGIVH